MFNYDSAWRKKVRLFFAKRNGHYRNVQREWIRFRLQNNYDMCKALADKVAFEWGVSW